MDEDEKAFIKQQQLHNEKMMKLFKSGDEEAIEKMVVKDFDQDRMDRAVETLKPELADCVSANASAFLWYLSQGKYPTEAKILPNLEGEHLVRGSKWHQLPEFKKLIESAYDWRLIQGTIINQEDFRPMAHSWCEGTVEDVKGLWKHFNSPDGRFVFDFTSRENVLCFQSVAQFNIQCKVPPPKYASAWEGVRWLYKRFAYTFDELDDVVHKPGNVGDWKFYEFDSDEINKHAGRTK